MGQHNGKHYLKYADDESENTSEIILFCPMCGRKLDEEN